MDRAAGAGRGGRSARLRSARELLDLPQRRKNDGLDTQQLCRLLRLGEIKSLYLPTDDARCAFKSTAAQYLQFTREQARTKQRIKVSFQARGIMEVTGEQIWSDECRQLYLDRLPPGPDRRLLERLYILLDTQVIGQESCLADLRDQGRRFGEIARFQAVPGVGPVVAHIFSAYVQTPERFATSRKLLSYCGFAITDRSSAGKPLGRERLDRNACRPLKAISFAAYRGAMHARDNVVKTYHQHVLDRTKNATHARLSTQRKILTTLYSIWKGDQDFDPHRFLNPPTNGMREQPA